MNVKVELAQNPGHRPAESAESTETGERTELFLLRLSNKIEFEFHLGH